MGIGKEETVLTKSNALVDKVLIDKQTGLVNSGYSGSRSCGNHRDFDIPG